MNVHFIAIGGAVMHNLAIALKSKGFQISGSDDSIKDPSRSRLDRHGLLPDSDGWDVSRITDDLDAVILGMHARPDNPELKKAQDMGIPIYSFPEFIYKESQNKKRVVIGGSHGKTSITSMIMHVMRECDKNFDYMVGSQLDGFDTMVEIKDENPLTILEGDEYLSSPIDRRPKFHLYDANVALISGIAWDHINVFPTFENYLEQFRIFAEGVAEDGHLVYCSDDEVLNDLIDKSNIKATLHPYSIPEHRIDNGTSFLLTDNSEVRLDVFGDHNLRNLEGARIVLSLIGIDTANYYKSITSFKGAARRLEKIVDTGKYTVFRDFAHSPSKLKATVNAVRKQFPERNITAVMELHTFSSLNREFLDEYEGSMTSADQRLVYFDPETVSRKKLPSIDKNLIKKGFSDDQLKVAESRSELEQFLSENANPDQVVIMMSSGNFSGLKIEDFFSN